MASSVAGERDAGFDQVDPPDVLHAHATTPGSGRVRVGLDGVHLPRAITQTARVILEQEGHERLTLARVAERLGIRTESLTASVGSQRALELRLVMDGVAELAEALEDHDDLLPLGRAYRRFALRHPGLYRLMSDRCVAGNELRAEFEARAAAPMMCLVGSLTRARATWALIHGLVMLELSGRLARGADGDAAWEVGLAALARARA